MEKYEGKNFIVYCGDALGILPALAPPVDAIICDLPYGTTACKWDVVIPFEPMWKEYKRLIKERGAVVLFGSQPFTSLLICSNLDWFKYEWVWNKSHATGQLNLNVRPMTEHENILVFGDGKIAFNPQLTKKPAETVRAATRMGPSDCYGAQREYERTIPLEMRAPTTVLKMNSVNHGERGLHPTQKPVDLLAYLVKTYTNEGEVVLDNCMGSGSCGVACLRTGRKFVGVEKDESYFKIACERLQREEDKVESGLFAQIENVKASEIQQPLFSETITYAYHTDGYAKTQVEVVGAGD